MNWIVMPVLNCLDYTLQALDDCLAQAGVDVRVLVVNNGSQNEVREALERRMEQTDSRILVWSHDPPLPSLSATWNRALRFVWQVGGEAALVVNNDVRLDPWTYAILLRRLKVEDALFVTAVGWDAARWHDTMFKDRQHAVEHETNFSTKGGPDFSCFLISKACHWKYPFDELFIPAYCEDLDYHRRLMLAGEGARIFSVNLPYLHYASRTVNEMTPDQQASWAKRSQQARRHYEAKWGGPVNQETFFSPFDRGVEGVSTAGMPNPPTTPALQAWVQEQGRADAGAAR